MNTRNETRSREPSPERDGKLNKKVKISDENNKSLALELKQDG